MTSPDVRDPLTDDTPAPERPAEEEGTEAEGTEEEANDPLEEWIVTNATGCYAMGTPLRLPERKYHGLLIAREASAQLTHVWAETAEAVTIGDAIYDLGNLHYDICIHPQGGRTIESFEVRDSVARWVYALGSGSESLRIERRLALALDRPAATVEYRLLDSDDGAASDAVTLTIAPLLTGRDVHAVDHDRGDPGIDWRPNGAVAVHLPRRDGTATLWLTRCASDDDAPQSLPMEPGSNYWNERVHYPEEERRGYPNAEDLFAPGHWRAQLRPDETIRLTVAWRAESDVAPTIDASLSQETREPSVLAQLDVAAASYCVRTPDGRASIIAGYPWFEEWGRDAFIALPGLLLSGAERDDADIALAGGVLDRFREHRKGGLIPNIVGADEASTDDHSIDATLFFIRAVEQVEAHAGVEIARRWWPDVLELLEAIRAGRGNGVKIDDAGLLAADRRPRAMTWMDALVDGVAVTPRAPYAVEIQALFHSAIDYALRIADRLERPAFTSAWSEIGLALLDSFPAMFECGGHLADSCDGTDRDEAVRPNQLFAVIGATPLVTGDLAAGVLRSVREELLTPVGLRTLEPGHPDYRGQCVGPQRDRDQTYHQGTVWPWLFGPYIDAVGAVEGESAAREEAKRIVAGFAQHMSEACRGHVSEIFDGDAPHTPRGAPAQAWSVSELRRIARV